MPRLPPELVPQHLSDQRMDPEPATDAEPMHEQTLGLAPEEHVADVAPARDRRGEARVDAIDHGDLQEYFDDIGVAAGQHLVPDVVLGEQLGLRK